MDLYELKDEALASMSYDDFVQHCKSLWPESRHLHDAIRLRHYKIIRRDLEKPYYRSKDFSPNFVMRLLEEGNVEGLGAAARQEIRIQNLKYAWVNIYIREFGSPET